MANLSARLAEIVEALPLRAGMRVIEIGCGPGAAARAVAERVGPTGHVLAVDHSAKAIEQVDRAAADLIAAGRLSVRQVAAEDLVPGGRLFIDGGDPLRELALPNAAGPRPDQSSLSGTA